MFFHVAHHNNEGRLFRAVWLINSYGFAIYFLNRRFLVQWGPR